MKLVTVRSYRDPVQAHVARAALDGAGIPSVVVDEHTITMQWLYSTAIGGAKLQVAERDLARAEAVLERHDEIDLGAVPESRLPAASGDRCPQCGAESVRKSRLLRATLALSLLTNVPVYLWRQRWICESCGYSWKAEPDPARDIDPDTLVAERSVQGSPHSYPVLLAFLLALGIMIAGMALSRWAAT